ncbi:hypothetical protein HETIRDRAFT_439100 [Heterobasidion irregulare TC 32-1]|uniref:DUF962-domain-containing protein n=1 Tax=Heterobasidion irregulare (strain TC 32-1) TaxID=747525 RepID=W4KEN0_HETIT|nr:uncharacterized protein HETIRDRAFT_439100 [Heterobasidion irregulare TC 32-1]ETW84268.1 hypothetical protein HETIRDRAFT_439100 [Heterobasidion irregulare TC 32-1]
MPISSLFDVRKQLTFYGAYHSNPTNVNIHIICVPLLLWSFQVLSSTLPVPDFFPAVAHKFNDYLLFDFNVAAVHAAIYLAYYFVLDPVAAFLYTPQMIVSLLTAISFSKKADNITIAALLHAVSWIAQFVGHGFAEKRAPALLDNLIGAVVLAPFFVHLEVLFMLGYRPELHKQLTNDVGKELARIRKIEGDKKRAKAL